MREPGPGNTRVPVSCSGWERYDLTTCKPLAAVLFALFGRFPSYDLSFISVAARTVDPVLQQLADAYAPVAVLREQSSARDKDGEGGLPAPVDGPSTTPISSFAPMPAATYADDPVLAERLHPGASRERRPEYLYRFPGRSTCSRL